MTDMRETGSEIKIKADGKHPSELVEVLFPTFKRELETLGPDYVIEMNWYADTDEFGMRCVPRRVERFTHDRKGADYE